MTDRTCMNIILGNIWMCFLYTYWLIRGQNNYFESDILHGNPFSGCTNCHYDCYKYLLVWRSTQQVEQLWEIFYFLFFYLNREYNVCRRWFPRALHKASDEFLSKQIWRISLFGRSHWTCFFSQCTWWTNNFRSNCTTLDQTFF